MCQRVYIASEIPLKIIPYNSDDPQFFVMQIDDSTPAEINTILRSAFIYEARSFMGCGCGLYFDDIVKEDPEENYNDRVRDVLLLKKYLEEHKINNILKLYITWWPDEQTEITSHKLNSDIINSDRFLLEEDVVYEIE